MKDHKPLEREFHFERLKKIISESESLTLVSETENRGRRGMPKRNRLIFWWRRIRLLRLDWMR